MLDKKIKNFLILSLSIFAFAGETHSKEPFPELVGPYLGQPLPGLTPQLFAPGIVSINGRYEYGAAFSPDLNEFYFSTQPEGEVASIYVSKVKDGKWQTPKRVNLTKGQKAGEMHPFVSHDNNKIYFTAYNPDFTDTKIWSASRIDNGWSNPAKLDSPINNEEVFYTSITNKGELFYTDIFKSQTYSSSFKNGKYTDVNKVNIEFGLHPFISPTQDYLLVDAVASDPNRKDKDIYVYFKQENGTWSKPVNLGKSVNSTFYETVPSVTPDGKYLFFSRYNEEGGKISNLYWVSTDVIEQLRPKK